MTERSRKLRRQFAKSFHDEEVETRLSALIERLRQDAPSDLAQDIDLLSRFPDFLTSVDKSYADYEEQTRLAYHNLEQGSAELNQANAELEELHLATAAMLNTLGQGLFSFGPDGLCTQIYSKSCLALLEGLPAGRPVTDVLCVPENQRESTTDLIGLLFSPVAQIAFLDDYLDLFPKFFPHSRGLVVSLTYRPIVDAMDKIQSILVIATDHTEERAVQQLSEERDQQARRTLRIARNRNMFTRFYQSASIYFSVAVRTLSSHVPLTQVKRDIHTIKGNAGLFYLTDLVDILHDMEGQLDKITTTDDAAHILSDKMPLLQKKLSIVKKEAEAILGAGFDRQGATRTLSLDLLRSFAVELRASGSHDELANRFISLLMGEPIRKLLSAFDIGLQELADRYGRSVSPCVYTGENLQILSENYDSLFASFTHISRNIIAHAIDSPEAREKWQKPAALTVTIDAQTVEKDDKKWLRLNITDDGRGVDVVKLRHRWHDAHPDLSADALSNDDLLQTIFQDSLSTRDEANDLSGRGVGLGAVKKEVERMGGTIKVESEINRFTRFVIDVPIIWM